MPRRLLRAFAARSTASQDSSTERPHGQTQHSFTVADLVWTMGGSRAVNCQPFDSELLVRQFPPPYNSDSFIPATRALRFCIKRKDCTSQTVAKLNLPCLAVTHVQIVKEAPESSGNTVGATVTNTKRPAIVVQANAEHIVLFQAGSNRPTTLTHAVSTQPLIRTAILPPMRVSNYRLGIRININVLNAEPQLFTAQRDLSEARYEASLQGFKLKAPTGTFSEVDLLAGNALPS